jgi:decaprenylphospho-beta-D-erythro-pentofuranosid-2-ulose 2-reductase
MCVLILGATSPIAKAVADTYAQKHFDIALAARDLNSAQILAQDLQIRYGIKTKAFAFDALSLDQHQTLINEVADHFGRIDIALLAFAEMKDQNQAQADLKIAKRMIDINYTGSVSVCELLAQKMIDQGAESGAKLGIESEAGKAQEQGTQKTLGVERPAIIVISSVAGEKGRKSNYIYGSTKGALTIYLQGLRNRLHTHHIQVLTAILGFVDTPMTYGLQTPIPIATPENTAKAIFEAQQAGKDLLYYPLFWRGIMTVIKALPEWVFKRTSI